MARSSLRRFVLPSAPKSRPAIRFRRLQPPMVRASMSQCDRFDLTNALDEEGVADDHAPLLIEIALYETPRLCHRRNPAC